MKTHFKIAGIAAVLAAVSALPSAALAEPVSGSGTGARCFIELTRGVYTWYDEGSTLTVTDAQGNKTTYTCKNGTWVKTASLTTSSTLVFAPVSSYTRVS
jgi:hypothetical protein